jgi:hypothetical protein
MDLYIPAVSIGASISPRMVATITQNTHLGIFYLRLVWLVTSWILANVKLVFDDFAVVSYNFSGSD